ncbi:MAG: 2-amino-4-hydroxy-6-hydroxymethyldihydropteridine diphosphokinase, partial [Deltaproteobacteria bacterium]
LRRIRQLPSTRVHKVSTLIVTEPLGGPPGQGRYLNGVIEIETELFPYQLLAALQRIEFDLGRVRTVADGPRTIDLDILSYGDAVLEEEGLVIPHPRMFTRFFVTRPLEEISPGAVARLKRLGRKRIIKKRSRTK